MSYGLRGLRRVLSTLTNSQVTPTSSRRVNILPHPILTSLNAILNREDSPFLSPPSLRGRQISRGGCSSPTHFPFHRLSSVSSFAGRSHFSSPFLFPVHSYPSLASTSLSFSSLYPIQARVYATSPPPSHDNSSDNARSTKRLSLGQRFKNAYKNYGWVLLAFHWSSYVGWLLSLTALSYSGIDVIALLQWLHNHMGLPQSVITTITKSGAGHLAIGFLLCKLITPIRYVTTFVGTKYTADYLRKRGILKPIPPTDSLGNLAKESGHIINCKTREIRNRLNRRGKKVTRDSRTSFKTLKSKLKRAKR